MCVWCLQRPEEGARHLELKLQVDVSPRLLGKRPWVVWRAAHSFGHKPSLQSTIYITNKWTIRLHFVKGHLSLTLFTMLSELLTQKYFHKNFIIYLRSERSLASKSAIWKSNPHTLTFFHCYVVAYTLNDFLYYFLWKSCEWEIVTVPHPLLGTNPF